MNIKKQLRNLYLYEIISGFQIVDAVWVLFLLGRGFSLAQAGLAHGIEELLMLRIESENQKLFSSEIRATLVSVSSMLYSVFMVILSPTVGWAAKEFSVAAAFTGLGIFVAGVGLVLALWKRR